MKRILTVYVILQFTLVLLIILYACVMPKPTELKIPVNMNMAIKNSDVIGIKEIIEENPNSVNSQNNLYRFTPLHLTLTQDYEDSVDIVRILLKSGADPNIYDSLGNNALHQSVIKRGRESLSYETYTKIVKVLLEYGANVHARNIYGVTPLHMASVAGANPKTIAILLGHGANVNAKTKVGGWTPLHGASSKNRLDIVKVLLKNGADKTIKDDKGRTPFDVARQLRYLDVANELGDYAFSEAEISPSPLKQEQPSETMPSVTSSLKKFTNTIGMEFVLIPAGRFKMGSGINLEEVAHRYGYKAEWLKNAYPQHSVEITKSFYLQKTEVTQGQWKKVMGNNPSKFNDYGDNFPVERVSWDDTQEFIKKLNEMEGTHKYRLPSEAEWEYACRAETATDFPFGDDARIGVSIRNRAGLLGDYAWFRDNSDFRSHSVGSKKPNSWGLCDMHGNIYEWVEDDYHSNYDMAPSDERAWIDNPRGTYRVSRGGGWFNDAEYCRSSARDCLTPTIRNPLNGFRLAMSVALGP